VRQCLPAAILGCSSTNVIRGSICFATMGTLRSHCAQHCVPIVGRRGPLLLLTRQTDMDGPIRCSSLTLEHKSKKSKGVPLQPRFTPGERIPGTHWIGGWVGPRAGLDAGARRKIVCLCRGSNLDRPVRSQTLYCLSYRG
jgi:hypothetical protein